MAAGQPIVSRKNKIATLIRGPLAQGLLTGKYDENTRFDDEIRAKWNESPGREEYLEKLYLNRDQSRLYI